MYSYFWFEDNGGKIDLEARDGRLVSVQAEAKSLQAADLSVRLHDLSRAPSLEGRGRVTVIPRRTNSRPATQRLQRPLHGRWDVPEQGRPARPARPARGERAISRSSAAQVCHRAVAFPDHAQRRGGPEAFGRSAPYVLELCKGGTLPEACLDH